MMFWTLRPESWVGWALMALSAAITVYALVVIARDARRRRFNGWDLAALAFVGLGGPGAALAFVAAHDFFELRARRKADRSRHARVAS
ncbi:hypothetical protein [Nocardioides ultimimeridianus]